MNANTEPAAPANRVHNVKEQSSRQSQKRTAERRASTTNHANNNRPWRVWDKFFEKPARTQASQGAALSDKFCEQGTRRGGAPRPARKERTVIPDLRSNIICCPIICAPSRAGASGITNSLLSFRTRALPVIRNPCRIRQSGRRQKGPRNGFRVRPGGRPGMTEKSYYSSLSGGRRDDALSITAAIRPRRRASRRPSPFHGRIRVD